MVHGGGFRCQISEGGGQRGVVAADEAQMSADGRG
jgi:hypothetical protein